MHHLATTLTSRLSALVLALALVATACGTGGSADTATDAAGDSTSSVAPTGGDEGLPPEPSAGEAGEGEGMFDDVGAEDSIEPEVGDAVVDDAADAAGVAAGDSDIGEEDFAMDSEEAMDDSVDTASAAEGGGSGSARSEPAAVVAITDDAAAAAADAAAAATEAAADAAATASVDAEADIIEPVPPRPAPTPAPQRPQAGLLTAGDIDDNLNLDYFAQLVGNWQQEEGRGVPFVELRDRITIDLVGANGVGVGNAVLTIDAGGDRHDVVTDSAGRAQLFPTWMGLDVTDGLTVRAASSEWALDAVDYDDGSIELTLDDGDTTPPSSLDVALVLDVTGSMADELAYLTVEFDSIVARVEADYGNVDMRFALVVYRDFGDDFVTRVFDFTGDVDEMRQQLADQYANGGGDFPEAMDSALVDASDLSWRDGDGVARVLVLNADAPPHQEKIAAALATARDLGEDGVRIYPLAASGVDRNAEFIMRAMAVTTGGRHMFLTGDSGVGGAKLEPKAECYLVTGLDDLLYRVLATELAGERIEPADSQIVRTVGQYDRGVCN